MAATQKYTDADFALFEPAGDAYNRNAARKIDNAAPKRNGQKQPDIKLLPKKKKSLAQAKREMHAAAMQGTKIVVIALCLLSMFAMLLYSRLRADEITREIDRTNAMLTQAQGENVRLNMAIDSMISLEKVEDYAKNTLGMTKVEGYQIEYIDLSGTDEVVKSGGKSTKVENEKSIFEKLKAYLQTK